MLPIACYAKLYLVIHSIEDVVVTSNNVAHVPGLGLIFFVAIHDKKITNHDKIFLAFLLKK